MCKNTHDTQYTQNRLRVALHRIKEKDAEIERLRSVIGIAKVLHEFTGVDELLERVCKLSARAALAELDKENKNGTRNST